MESQPLGRFHGLWSSEGELCDQMLRVTEMDEVPVRVGDAREGMLLRLRGEPAVVFEVLLADAVRERFYLVVV